MQTIASVTLPETVQLPQYDRRSLRSRIVHFGFGAFHRAHQALLTDRVLNALGATGAYVRLACSAATS
jgi:mannitol-1-phosphate/altronate dehydrogenase